MGKIAKEESWSTVITQKPQLLLLLNNVWKNFIPLVLHLTLIFKYGYLNPVDYMPGKKAANPGDGGFDTK